MKLRDLSQYIEIDIDEALEERFMDSEELYVRFLKKLEAANDLAAVADFAVESFFHLTVNVIVVDSPLCNTSFPVVSKFCIKISISLFENAVVVPLLYKLNPVNFAGTVPLFFTVAVT